MHKAKKIMEQAAIMVSKGHAKKSKKGPIPCPHCDGTGEMMESPEHESDEASGYESDEHEGMKEAKKRK